MTQTSLECSDFLRFQDAIKKMREIDDKIIYALNTTIPTESFRGQIDATSKCKDLYSQLDVAHNDRQNAIKRCISVTADKVKGLKLEKDNKRDDIVFIKKLKAEQTKLRSLQVELSVEEVIKERSSKVFHERCRNFYNPESQS